MYRSRTIQYKLTPLVVAILSGIFANSCTLKVENLTPPQFPWTAADLLSLNDVLYPGSTPGAVSTLGENSAHRFLLETKRQNVTDVSTFVTVNGTEHRMTEYSGTSGNGVWFFESLDECQATYNYHFRTRYKRGLYGWATKTVGSAASPHTVQVAGSGDVIWWSPAGDIHPSAEPGDPELKFVQDAYTEHTIIIQNLRNGPVTLYGIGLEDGFVGATHNHEFEVLDVPTEASGFPLPPAQSFVLECGESLQFRVRWNGQTVGAAGALSIHATEFGGTFQMNRILLLSGRPHPG